MTSHLDEFNVSSTSQGVKGCLKASINFWIDRLEAPEFVISMIREGYRIPFGTYPTRCFLKNNNSALKHPEFVESAILELLANGCIEEHATPPLCVNPLTVAEGKKLRLVIDLRHVNDFLVKPKFKYEDLRSLSEVVEENHWFFTWDLKSGYHHVDIFKDHQKYLGFSWAFQGVLRYFTFCVLPFGLSSACYCFTKLMRPLVKRWRSMGHLSFVYLDDGFSSHADKLSAIAASTIQSQDLKSSGLMCNEEKSHWAPTQIGEWLGFIINTISMEFHVPDKKLTKLKDMLGAVIQDGSTTLFQVVNARWGPHTIDRFASHYNAQLIAFNSKYACPGSCGIDALSQDWSSGNSWLCPPVHLIVGCVRHLAEHRGRGTLVVPEWHSAYFWPFLCTSANSFKPFVKSVFVLPKIHDLLLEGPGQLATYKRKASVFSGCPPFNMLALKLDFIADHLV